ncbi:MAG: hypothetical protein P4L83_22470 [Nevskia sp.]|nr:hypothetical protein [Nevskia sp.]
MRRDDNDNEFLVRADLSYSAATALARRLEAGGHKQMYWARRQ